MNAPPQTPGRLERLYNQLAARRSLRYAAAALSGVVLAVAFPPYNFLPAIVAYSALLVLLQAGESVAKRPFLARFWTGAAFGFGFHLMGLWWIGAAFLVDADRYAALLPFAVIGLPLLLASFTGLATLLIGVAPHSFAWRGLALALTVSFTEWLRSFVLTGFPWNAAGVGVTQSSLMSQSAAVVGVNGLAFVVVLFGALPAALAERRSRWLAAPVGIILAAMTTFGILRLLTEPPSQPDALRVRVVQPSVPQHLKWDPVHRDTIWRRLLTLSDNGNRDGPADVVVWPETAVPFLYRTPSIAQRELAAVLMPATMLITGAAEVTQTATGPRTFNTVLVLNPSGDLVARYDKSHLVPFGEYVPFAELLSALGFSALAAGNASFVAGPEPQTISVPELPPFQPLVCYEVIFPHLRSEDPARWIVNVTNDAWFGVTPGPRQHLRHSRLRAVERGLPVVRAANTGISAIIDASGRVVARLPLNREGAITAPLPPPRFAPYGVWGDIPLYALWFIGGFVIFTSRWLTRRYQ
ncbi:MAG: apolipoprotein N-acyltransferase, partial [Pseudomonadota bacterium]